MPPLRSDSAALLVRTAAVLSLLLAATAGGAQAQDALPDAALGVAPDSAKTAAPVGIGGGQTASHRAHADALDAAVLARLGDAAPAEAAPAEPVQAEAVLPDSLARALRLALRAASRAAPDTTDEVRADGERPRPVALSVFGYYRFFGYGRNITEPYPNLAPFERAYGVGDGYREPMLSLNILGRPNGRSSFGTELFVFTPYDGQEDFESNTISLNLGVNLYGNFRTEAGTFGVRAGGIHWYNLSPFTIGVYQPLDRYSIFERTPWEGVAGTTKYDNYFETGEVALDDERFDFQAFQGLILNGAQLPGDLSFDLFWGKTQPNGGLPGAVTDPGETVPGEGDVPTYNGFAGEARALPSFITGGSLERDFGVARAALNSIYSYRTLDSLTTERRAYQVHTASFDADIGGVNLSGELGGSLFESPDVDDPTWGEALMVRAKTTADQTVLPLDVQLYQIGRNFFNENSEIRTNNNPRFRVDPRCEVVPGSGAAGATITQVNELEHNRRGVNVNTSLAAGPARLGVGWGMAHELAPTTTTLTYVHRVNGLAMSRVYNPFPAGAVCATQFGPNQRKYSIFRGAIERAQTTDVDPVTGLATNRKYYHAVDLQGKLRGTVADRPVYLFYLGSFGSANPTATVVPRDDDTYLFAQYHEFDLYVGLSDRFLLAGYLGLENVRGGRFTEIDATTGSPRDQRGRGVGIGFDWSVAKNAGLYLRHRWMDFEDQGFEVDAYEGRETTLEFKMFF